MAYDKIKQSAEYENKKTQLSGHNIPLETIKEVVATPPVKKHRKEAVKCIGASWKPTSIPSGRLFPLPLQQETQLAG